MKLEDQVCSLEYAKRLRELGVKQRSLVYWLNIQHCVHMKVKENGWELEEDENGNLIVDKIDYRTELGNPAVCNIDKDNCWAAFTVSELGEMIKNINFVIELDNKKNWMIHFWIDKDDHAIPVNNKKEADARAQMLIYAIENKLMELPNES